MPKPKLTGVIWINGVGYGLYLGPLGPAWFGPPGPMLNKIHEIQADYDINGPDPLRVPGANLGYSPNPLGDMVEYIAAYFGGQVLQLPEAPQAKEGRVY